MGFNREYLGAIEVTSGVIELKDAYHKVNDANRDAGVRTAASEEGFCGIAKSIYIGTFYKDGRYSVFGHRNDQGEFTSVEIILDETEDNKE